MSLSPLTLPPGVVRSSTPALSRGRYWDTNLVRWRAGALRPVGGWDRITSQPLAKPARRLHAWRDLSDIPRTAIANDDGITILEGDTYTDITPTGFSAVPPLTREGGFGVDLYNTGTFGSPRPVNTQRVFYRANSWALDNFGSSLMALSTTDGRLLQWTTTLPLPAKMTVVANAPVNNRAMLVTEERHVMVFGSAGVPYRVAWCSRETPTDWDFTSVTNTAGFFDLGISGWIVQAVKVRGGVLIFTDSDVWLARYVGAPFVYGFEKIGEACSLFSPYSYAVSSSSCMWMGRETFWLFDGGTVKPLASDVGEYLFKDVDLDYGPSRAFASANGLFPEVWLFYPSKGQTECDRYVIWSWHEGWWALGRLPRTAMLSSGVSPYPVLGGGDANLYRHERGWTDAGLTRVGQVYAETGPLALQNGARVYDVVQGHMDTGLGYGGSLLRAITSFTADGEEYVEGPYYPRADGWLDCRFSARDARLRIEAAEDREWSVGEIRLDLQVAGER